MKASSKDYTRPEDRIQVLKRDDGTIKEYLPDRQAASTATACRSSISMKRRASGSNRYDVTVLVNSFANGACGGSSAVGWISAGLQIKSIATSATVSGRDPACSVCAAVCHQQWHPDQCITATVRDGPSGRTTQQTLTPEDLQRLFVHQLVGRREESAHHRTTGFTRTFFAKTFVVEHFY